MASNYEYTYFACDVSRWDSATEAIWGSHGICLSLMWFQVLGITRVGLSAISQAGGWGNPKRPLYGMAYLLLVPAQEAEEERRFGLVGVWVHPNQALLPSLEEATRKLTLLVNTKEDWHYAFVWVSEDLQHIPLSDARHISILVDGAPGRSACGQLSQLEIYLLLHLGSEVVYLEGLNGGLELVQVPLPKLPIWEAESTCETTQLQITLPRTTQGDSLKAVPLQLLMPVSSPCSVTECPSEIVTCPSITEEIEDLLSNPMFEMPGEPSTCTSPRRPSLVAPNNPVASRGEVLPDPGKTLPGYLKQPPWSPHESSQAGMANVTAHSSHSPSPTWNMPEWDTSLTPFQSPANSINLSDDVLHLQEEMNNATVLLTARALIDNHHQRIISKTEVSHYQNEINLTETIRAVKARYTTTIGDAESTYMTGMRKVEAAHSASTSKAEVIHATRVRKVEAANAVQASKL